MPTYKALPISKKTEPLPLYRPMDRWITAVWEKRGILTPLAIVVLIVLLAFVGLKTYAFRYEAKASALLDRGQAETAILKYPRSDAARLARLKLGKQALDAKDYDKAIQWYAPLTENADAPAILKIAATQNLALAHLKKGDAVKAVEVLDRAAKDRANLTADYTQLLLARAYEVKGDVEAAKGLYRTLSETAVQAAVQDEAKERLTWMEPEKVSP